MTELTQSELDNVAGGLLPLLAVLGFVYYERQNIRDYAEAYFEAYDTTIKAH